MIFFYSKYVLDYFPNKTHQVPTYAEFYQGTIFSSVCLNVNLLTFQIYSTARDFGKEIRPQHHRPFSILA